MIVKGAKWQEKKPNNNRGVLHFAWKSERKRKIKLQKQRTAEYCDCSTYLQSCRFQNGSWHRLWVCCCIRQSKFSRAISPFHIWRGLASYFSGVTIICFVCITPAASPCIFSHLNFFLHLITFSRPHTDVTAVDILTRHFCFAEHLIEYPRATSTLEKRGKKRFGDFHILPFSWRMKALNVLKKGIVGDDSGAVRCLTRRINSRLTCDSARLFIPT